MDGGNAREDQKLQIKVAVERVVETRNRSGFLEFDSAILLAFASDLRSDRTYHSGRHKVREIRHQEDISSEDSDGEKFYDCRPIYILQDFNLTLLHVAAYYGCVEEIKKLLELDAYDREHRNDREKLSSRGQTALHFAIDSEQPLAVAALLEEEKLILTKSREGLAPIDFVLQLKRVTRGAIPSKSKLHRMLVDKAHKEASVWIKEATNRLEARNISGSIETRQDLRSRESDFLRAFASDLKNDPNYWGIWHSVQHIGEEEDIGLEDFNLTLLHVAVYYGCVPEIERLLKIRDCREHVNDLELLTTRGQTALHFATNGGPRAVAALLKEETLVPVLESRERLTPLGFLEQEYIKRPIPGMARWQQVSQLINTRFDFLHKFVLYSVSHPKFRRTPETWKRWRESNALLEAFGEMRRILMYNKVVLDSLYKDRQIAGSVVSTNMVVAGLIASVTFGGYRQPPDSAHDFLSELLLQSFRIFNTLAFYSALTCLCVGAAAVLPSFGRSTLPTVQKVHSVQNSVFFSTWILCGAIVFASWAFLCTSYVASAPGDKSFHWAVIISIGAGLWFVYFGAATLAEKLVLSLVKPIPRKLSICTEI